MLVLSRKANEAIVFPELGIRVVVVAISRNSVKLGIEADKQHTILRAELLPDKKTTPPEQGSTVHVETVDASASGVS